jgi:hypothetical protein
MSVGHPLALLLPNGGDVGIQSRVTFARSSPISWISGATKAGWLDDLPWLLDLHLQAVGLYVRAR